MPVPEDFMALMPQRQGYDGPWHHLWVFDPVTGKAKVEDNRGRHEAELLTHTDLAKQVPHPERVHGYAYKIDDGWRITDWEHRPVNDGYIVNEVLKALR